MAKISSDGSRVLWATYLGGSSRDEIWSIAVDAASNVHVARLTSSPDFPVMPGAYRTQPGEGFVATLSSDGSTLLASTYLEGLGTSIAVDMAGFVYVSGSTSAASFPTTPGAFQTSRYPEWPDGLVVKLDPALKGARYSTLLGGSLSDGVYAIAVDAQGQAHVAGTTESWSASVGVRFPVTANAFQRPGGSGDVFVAKLDASGAAFVFSSVFGGPSGLETGVAVVLDAAGDLYVAGSAGADFPITVATPDSPGAAFLVKVNSGGSLLWSAGLPARTGPLDATLHVAVHSSGRVFVTGTASGSVQTTADALNPCRPLDLAEAQFAITMDQSPTRRLYGSWLRGATALDRSGTVWLPGETQILDRFSLENPLRPQVRCISSAATYFPERVAPGEVVSLFGQGIGPAAPVSAQLDKHGRLATELGATAVLLNGVPAPLLYVGPTQINAIVPFDAAGWQTATVVVRKEGIAVPSVPVTIVSAMPGIFERGIANSDNYPNSPQRRARAGSIIQVWATGGGLMQPLPANGELGPGLSRIAGEVRVTGHIPGAWHGNWYRDSFALDVLYAGDAPGLPQGIIQINARLPNPIPVRWFPDDTALTVTINGVESPRFPLWIEP